MPYRFQAPFIQDFKGPAWNRISNVVERINCDKTGFSALEYCVTEYVRPDRCGERWLNVFAQKRPDDKGDG